MKSDRIGLTNRVQTTVIQRFFNLLISTFKASLFLILPWSSALQAGTVTFEPTYEAGSAWIGNTTGQAMVQQVFDDFSSHLRTSGAWNATIEIYLTDDNINYANAVPDGYYTSTVGGENCFSVNAFRQIVDGAADPNGPIQSDGTNADITVHFNVSSQPDNAGLLRHEMMHGLGTATTLPYPRIDDATNTLSNTGAGSTGLVSCYDRLLYDHNRDRLIGNYNAGNSEFTINNYVARATYQEWRDASNAGLVARGIDELGAPLDFHLMISPYGDISDNIAQSILQEPLNVMSADSRSHGNWNDINNDDRAFLRAMGYTMSTVSAPDLVVINPEINKTPLLKGEAFTLSATTQNQGSAAAAATTLRYYLSTDASITTSDTEIGTDVVDILAASATENDDLAANAPTAVGTYWVGACVDSVTDESNITNQCSTALQMVVKEEETLCFPVKSTEGKVFVICL